MSLEARSAEIEPSALAQLDNFFSYQSQNGHPQAKCWDVGSLKTSGDSIVAFAIGTPGRESVRTVSILCAQNVQVIGY